MEKEIVNQVQEVQRVPYRINPRRNTPRHTLIKLTKTKHQERIKSSKGEATSNIQGKTHRINSGSSAETLWAKREWQDIFKVLKGKNLQPGYSAKQGSHSKLIEKSKAFQTSKS